MIRKNIALLAAAMLFVSIALTGGVALGAPDPTASPSATADPTATAQPTDPPNTADTEFPPLVVDASLKPSTADATVSISDSKLKAALHTATGIAAQTPIKRSDLAKLTGGLDLSGKGIAKLEGLQYCENITALKLSSNNIADLPSSFSKLTKLKILLLDKNKLTKMPDALFSLTALTTLSMSSNEITKIPDKINLLSQLTDLNLYSNRISAVPSNISKLTQLKTLNLSKNSFKEISRDPFMLPALEKLDLSRNTLKEIPNEVTSAPKLVVLNLNDNILTSLPTGLGSAPSLLEVYASVNRLTIIEPTLLSGKVTHLTLDVNRILDLPTGLQGKTFDVFSVEWNFIDMSEGSEARKIGDTVKTRTGSPGYLRQLKFLAEPQAKATTTTVSLTWQPLPDGQDGESSWSVIQYEVYLDKNGTWVNLSNKKTPIAELDKLANQYVVTGLKADTSYKFQVGVEYTIKWNDITVPTHRFYTAVEAKTLATNATAEPTVEPTEEPLPTVEDPATLPPDQPTEVAEPTSAPTSASGGNKTLLVILVIVGAVVALAVIGGLAFSMMKRSKRPY